MKRAFLAVLAVVLVVVIGLTMYPGEAEAQLGKVFSVLGRRAVIDDSLRVGGITTINGNIVARDSVRVGNTFTLNGKAVVRDSVRVPRLIVSNRALAAGDSIAGMLRFDGTNVLFWSGSAWLQLNN